MCCYDFLFFCVCRKLKCLLFKVDAKKLQKAEAKLKDKLEKRTGSDPKLRPIEM